MKPETVNKLVDGTKKVARNSKVQSKNSIQTARVVAVPKCKADDSSVDVSRGKLQQYLVRAGPTLLLCGTPGACDNVVVRQITYLKIKINEKNCGNGLFLYSVRYRRGLSYEK